LDTNRAQSAIAAWEAVFSEEDREVYSIYRRPDRPAFPWRAAALLVVDVTSDFLGPRVPTIEAARAIRTACGIPAWDALGPIADLLVAFRSAQRPVYFTKGFDAERFGGAAVGGIDPAARSRIVPEVAPAADDIVIEKPRASAFFGTPLTSLLVRSQIAGVVVAGGTTSGCVRSTSVDAASLGFSVVLAHDACFDRSPLSHAVALFELDVKYATVMSASDIVDRLDARETAAPAGIADQSRPR
jgi:nicotinamidase-related amidase